VSSSLGEWDNSSMEAVTVRFIEDARSQEQLLRELRSAADRMTADRLISNVRIDPVFPGAVDARSRAVFVLRFDGLAARAVQFLSALPGVLRAHVASTRRMAAR